MVKTGKNSSRIKGIKEEVQSYTYEDLVRDISEFSPYKKDEIKENVLSVDEENFLASAGDVIFSLISSTAGIVSENSEGKILNQNFAKLTIKDKQIDPRYLCYCLNHSSHLKKQMAVAMQGSTLRRLTPSSLRELDIPIIELSKQELIGHAYFSLLKRQYLLEQKMKQEEEFALSLLEAKVESEMNKEDIHE